MQTQADRNRANQRNFRARRQEYVRELEQQLRELQDQKIQATREVQVAARLLKQQNVRLRSLLKRRFGVSECEIDEFLSESEDKEHASGLTPSAVLGRLDGPEPENLP